LVTPALRAFSFASRMRSGSMSMPSLDAVLLRRGDGEAAVARAQVVEHVALAHVGEAQHVVDHLVRRRHEDDVGLLRGLARLRLGEQPVGRMGFKSGGRRRGENRRGNCDQDSHP